MSPFLSAQRTPSLDSMNGWDPRKTHDFDFSDIRGEMRENGAASLLSGKTSMPRALWAWRFVVLGTVGGTWVRDLVLSAITPTFRKEINAVPALLLRSSSSATTQCATSATFPPELFKSICAYADRQSTSFRLVSKYWEQQCRPLIFPKIALRGWELPRVRELLDETRDSTSRFIPHVKSIDYISVPLYHEKTESPFLHLLGQTGIPIDGIVTIQGPFRTGHRSIRSVHFAVPRSLPSAFSRGIRELYISFVDFGRFEDLANLASELPDLEVLDCTHASVGSFPTELQRRRPWKRRNKLRSFALYLESEEVQGTPALGLLNLFLSIYSSTSFLNEGEVAIAFALLHRIHPSINVRPGGPVLSAKYEYDSETGSRMFEISTDCHTELSFAIRTRPDASAGGHALSSTFVYLYAGLFDFDRVGWRKVDVACRGLSQPPQFVVGARSRSSIVDFARNVVDKVSSLFRPGAVLYSLQKDWYPEWYRTSLDSDKLEGEGKLKLTDVYP